MRSRGIFTACRPLQGLLGGLLQGPALLLRTGWLAESGKEGLQAQGKRTSAAVHVLLNFLLYLSCRLLLLLLLLLMLMLLAVCCCFHVMLAGCLHDGLCQSDTITGLYTAISECQSRHDASLAAVSIVPLLPETPHCLHASSFSYSSC